MPKVSTYTRKRIQSLHEQNLHPVEIFKVLKGEDLAVSYQSVARIANKLKLTGSANNLPRSGRPRKINPEAQAFNEEQTRRNDETTSREIQKKLAKHGLIVHASTIRQSRKEQGWTHKHDTANWSGKPTKSRDWSSPCMFLTLEIHSIVSSSPTNALQHCEKVMQAKCTNFVLCSPDFSRETSQKSSSWTSWHFAWHFAGTKSDFSLNFHCLSDKSRYFASQDKKFR